MKTNLDKVFKTDKKIEEDGIWFSITDETKFRIRRFDRSSQHSKAMYAKYMKPYAHQLAQGTLDADKEQEIFIKLFVYTAMVDWKGVEINDVDTPYSPEVAIEFFKHVPDVLTALVKYASDFQNFREELGNS